MLRRLQHVAAVGGCNGSATTQVTKRGVPTCSGKMIRIQSKHCSSKSTTKNTIQTQTLLQEGTKNNNSISSKTGNNHTNQQRKKRSLVSNLSSLTLLTAVGYSIYTRKWREDHLMDVPSVNESDFFLGNSNNSSINNTKYNGNHNHKEGKKLRRDLFVLEKDIARNGLMGKSDSVKDDLDRIRSWHQAHGYKGGIVLRELSIPLYSPESNDEVVEGGDDVEYIPLSSSQRECYYLYYEIKPNGQTLHQIFCRGTTISDDVYTCLQSRLVYDDQLGIHVHSGFLDHANRLVDDVLPLLGPTNSVRSTVEVSGHSLGGMSVQMNLFVYLLLCMRIFLCWITTLTLIFLNFNSISLNVQNDCI